MMATKTVNLVDKPDKAARFQRLINEYKRCFDAAMPLYKGGNAIPEQSDYWDKKLIKAEEALSDFVYNNRAAIMFILGGEK